MNPWLELLTVYTSKGKETPFKLPKEICHILGVPHGATDCVITTPSRDKFLITKRSDTRLWDAGVGGHRNAKYIPKDNMIKEILEELFSFSEDSKLDKSADLYSKIVNGLTFIGKSVHTNRTKTGYKNVHTSHLYLLYAWEGFDGELKVNKEAIEDVRWTDIETIKVMLSTSEVCSGFNIVWTDFFQKVAN